MSKLTLLPETVSADGVPTYKVQETTFTNNVSQQLVIIPESTRDLLLASEKALASVWATPEEDEAWKDL